MQKVNKFLKNNKIKITNVKNNEKLNYTESFI